MVYFKAVAGSLWDVQCASDPQDLGHPISWLLVAAVRREEIHLIKCSTSVAVLAPKKWQGEYHQLKYIYSKDTSLVPFFGVCYCHIDGCTLRYLSTSLDVYGDCVELRKHSVEDFPVQLEDAT